MSDPGGGVVGKRGREGEKGKKGKRGLNSQWRVQKGGFDRFDD